MMHTPDRIVPLAALAAVAAALALGGCDRSSSSSSDGAKGAAPASGAQASAQPADAPADGAPKPGATRRYFNKERGFSMAFPEGWDVKENTEFYAMVGVSPEEKEGDPLLENVTVVFDPVPANMDMGQFVSLGKRTLRENLTDYQLLAEGQVGIWKYPAARFDFIHTDQGKRTRAVMFLMMIDGRGCSITASSTPEDWDRWELPLILIAGSFEQP